MLLESKALNFTIQSYLIQKPSVEGKNMFDRIMATYFDQHIELIDLLDHLSIISPNDEELEAAAEFVCDFKKPLQMFHYKASSSTNVLPPVAKTNDVELTITLLEKQTNAISLQSLPDDLSRAIAKSRESLSSFLQSDQQRKQVVRQHSSRATDKNSSRLSIVDLLREKQSGVFKQLQQLLEDEETRSSDDPEKLLGPEQLIVCILSLLNSLSVLKE